jgi:hypothetical protein
MPLNFVNMVEKIADFKKNQFFLAAKALCYLLVVAVGCKEPRDFAATGCSLAVRCVWDYRFKQFRDSAALTS